MNLNIFNKYYNQSFNSFRIIMQKMVFLFILTVTMKGHLIFVPTIHNARVECWARFSPLYDVELMLYSILFLSKELRYIWKVFGKLY